MGNITSRPGKTNRHRVNSKRESALNENTNRASSIEKDKSIRESRRKRVNILERLSKRTKKSPKTRQSPQKVATFADPLYKDDVDNAEHRTMQVTEFNFLITGPPGVGKSTLINSFINYLQYQNLEEAKSEGVETAIPSIFTIYDDKFQEHTIVCGSHTGEDNKKQPNVSLTQECHTYLTSYKNMIIHLIDTPGIGNSEESEQDDINIKKIMDYVKSINHIHGIIIVLKPNESRLESYLNVCLNNLLLPLQNLDISTVFFCFTHTRSTFYKPDDTLLTLKKLLSDKDINIPIGDERIYSVDNEAYRYLCIVKQVQVGYSSEDVHHVSTSWRHSASETKRLLDFILEGTTKDTVSISDYLHVSATAMVNAERKTFTIYDQFSTNFYDLRDTNDKNEEHPDSRIVCENECCVEHLDFDNDSHNKGIFYQKYCIDDDLLYYLQQEEKEGENGNSKCADCECSFKKHKEICPSGKKVKGPRLSLSLHKSSKKRNLQYFFAIQRDKTQLIEICTKLYYYAHEMGEENDIVKEHLEQWIDKLRSTRLQVHKEIANHVEHDLRVYEKGVKKLLSAKKDIKNSKELVDQLIEELRGLEILGQYFKEMD